MALSSAAESIAGPFVSNLLGIVVIAAESSATRSSRPSSRSEAGAHGPRPYGGRRLLRIRDARDEPGRIDGRPMAKYVFSNTDDSSHRPSTSEGMLVADAWNGTLFDQRSPSCSTCNHGVGVLGQGAWGACGPRQRCRAGEQRWHGSWAAWTCGVHAAAWCLVPGKREVVDVEVVSHLKSGTRTNHRGRNLWRRWASTFLASPADRGR